MKPPALPGVISLDFVNALGDRQLRCLDIMRLQYSGVFPTTWMELTKLRLLEDLNSQVEMYRLTGPGYVEALRVSGRSEEQQFRKDLGNLCKVLKDSLRGRSEDALVSLYDVVTNSGLSEAFVENAIDADLIGKIFGTVGAHWDGESQVIRVPHNFGLPPMG